MAAKGKSALKARMVLTAISSMSTLVFLAGVAFDPDRVERLLVMVTDKLK